MKANLVGGINKALRALGDLKIDVVLKRNTTNSYDPETGTITVSAQTWKFKAVVVNDKEAHRPDGQDINIAQGLVEQRIVRLMCAQSELTTVPNVDDRVSFFNNEYDVLSVSQDGAQALWILDVVQL